MKIKISAAILAFILITALLAACNGTPKTEPASQYSDADSGKIAEEFSHINNQLNIAEEMTDAQTPEDFKGALENASSDTASYSGNEDITISLAGKTEKTVRIDTEGSVNINSEMQSLVLDRADGGFSANASIDSLIIVGADVTADIKNETGSIYIKGKNTVINVMTASIGKIVINNIYTTVNNTTEAEIFVTLTNGAKVRIPALTTYNAQDNTLQKYTPAK